MKFTDEQILGFHKNDGMAREFIKRIAPSNYRSRCHFALPDKLSFDLRKDDDQHQFFFYWTNGEQRIRALEDVDGCKLVYFPLADPNVFDTIKLWICECEQHIHTVDANRFHRIDYYCTGWFD